MGFSDWRIFLISFWVYGGLCPAEAAWGPVDAHATLEARALHQRLFRMSRDYEQGKIIYGHQNAFHEGRGWRASSNEDWKGSLPESDLHKAFGVDPGVVGYDFGEVGPWNEQLWIEQFRAIHARGGVVTLSWHMPNFNFIGVDSNAWDTSGRTVWNILNDPLYRVQFLARIERLAGFLRKIPDVPILFRPWHEHNGYWFWWGRPHCTAREYQDLWRLTLAELRARGLHQLVVVYSPDQSGEGGYFERYPGDAWVDVLGYDMYFRNPHQNDYRPPQEVLPYWKRAVYELMREADRRGKIPAITEIGNEGLKLDRFWQDYFAWPLLRGGLDQWALAQRLPGVRVRPAYALLWRNDRDSPGHFFSPFPGAPMNEGFKQVLEGSGFCFMASCPP
jgi:mannan endo-1,4-beta-mannosidase